MGFESSVWKGNADSGDGNRERDSVSERNNFSMELSVAAFGEPGRPRKRLIRRLSASQTKLSR
jgi:hypothetical protein